jgi:hypothetical protein
MTGMYVSAGNLVNIHGIIPSFSKVLLHEFESINYKNMVTMPHRAYIGIRGL